MIDKEIESKDKNVALNKSRFFGMYQFITNNTGRVPCRLHFSVRYHKATRHPAGERCMK